MFRDTFSFILGVSEYFFFLFFKGCFMILSHFKGCSRILFSRLYRVFQDTFSSSFIQGVSWFFLLLHGVPGNFFFLFYIGCFRILSLSFFTERFRILFLQGVSGYFLFLFLHGFLGYFLFLEGDLTYLFCIEDVSGYFLCFRIFFCKICLRMIFLYMGCIDIFQDIFPYKQGVSG